MSDANGRFTETPYKFTKSINATGKQPSSSATETAIRRKLREIRRVRRGGFSLAKRKTNCRTVRRILRCGSRETVDVRHGRARLVCNERNWQRVCIACVATTED